jgi:hypothetical protein
MLFIQLRIKNMSDRFVHELPLKNGRSTEPILDLRFELARALYNACLREILRRLDLMKEPKEWQKARNLPKGSEKNTLFKTVIKKHCFSEYDLHTWLTTFLKLFPLKNHLDSQVCQKIAKRAFGSAKEYSLAKRGRPRFKGYGQFSSVEGKSNLTGIRFKEEEVLWMGIRLCPLFSTKDPYGVEAHALHSCIKYVRLVRRRVLGHRRYYVILEGKPLVKRKASLGKVGIDLGPSTIAIVSEKGSFLEVCQCGREAKKKPLNQRWHDCDCGVSMQRDLYSAFLALHAEENCLDRSTAQLDWSGAEPLLRQALSRCIETARDQRELVRFGLGQRQSSLPVKDGRAHIEAKDVVGYPLPRASESYADTAIRTPLL